MNYNKLTPEQQRVIENKATEAPFIGEYDNFYEDGTFICRKFVEFDVIVWHCWLFIQIVVTQGLSSTHIVEVELYSTVLLIAFPGRLFPTSAVKVKTITIVTTAITE